MEEKRVKGTMLLDQVRMIRANADLHWDDYLDAADWQVISQRILPSSWYPLEVYEHCGWALFNVLARGNVELVRARGRERGKELFATTYQSLIAGQRPIRALERFVRAYGLLFNFSSLRFEKISEHRARVHHEYASSSPTNLPYCHQLMGHLEALIEMAGGTDIRADFVARRWDGAPTTVFELAWGPAP